MAAFTDKETAFMTTERILGRLATIDNDGMPHLVPVGWSYDPGHDAIEVTGRSFARTKKFRNVKANARVAFLIDDVQPPWKPRSIMIQGLAEAIEEAGESEARIRIRPTKVISWGL